MSKDFKNIVILSLSAGGSRILGLLRDVLLFAALGASHWNSAFLLAFAFPNLFRRLLGEGAMTSAMVPVFSEVLEKNGRQVAFDFFSQIFLRLAIGLVMLCASIMLLLSLLLRMGYLPASWGLWAELSVWLLPYMVFICLSAVVAAVLNVLGRFVSSGLIPILLNLTFIGSLVAAMFLGKTPGEIIYWLCGGVLLGGLLQLLVPGIDFFRQGWRPHLRSDGHPDGLDELKRLLLPGLIGAAILQFNIMISRVLAHSLNESAVSVLYFSSRLMELPLGLFTVSVATVFFPLMARALSMEDEKAFAKSLVSGLRLILSISIPAAVGLVILNAPIVELFRFGQFSEAAGRATAVLVVIYSLGLPFYSAATFLIRGLHAGKWMRVTVQIAFVSLLVNFVGSLILMQFWAERGLAMANILAAFVQSMLLWWALTRRYEAVALNALLAGFGKVILAAFAMGVFCRLGLLVVGAFGLTGKMAALVTIAVLIPGGLIAYFGLLHLFRFKEISDLSKRCRRFMLDR